MVKKLYIELADNSLKRQCGLMGRKKLGKNEGMLFKFPVEQHLSFWMYNTYIPLDIAFVNEEGKILQISSMVPLSTKSIQSRHKCKYALEVNKGWFDNNNITEGSIIGGYGLALKKIAQVDMPLTQTTESLEPALEPAQETAPTNPDVLINKTMKELLEEANVKNKKMIVIYQTKGGTIMAPKVISPPFNFEDTHDGKTDGIVKVWDEQDAQWKSFIIDNIIDLELKPDEGI